VVSAGPSRVPEVPRTDVLGIDQLNPICPGSDVEAAGLRSCTTVVRSARSSPTLGHDGMGCCV
jgi:hypothetical protein